MAQHSWTAEDVARSNVEECAAQGLPRKVEDPSILRRVATLTTAGRPPVSARAS